MSEEMRVGIGVDAHAFAEGRKLLLGGVEIPHDRGLQGHSDADVVCHAATDAILGAAALGDIGRHFPDTDLSRSDDNLYLDSTRRDADRLPDDVLRAVLGDQRRRQLRPARGVLDDRQAVDGLEVELA